MSCEMFHTRRGKHDQLNMIFNLLGASPAACISMDVELDMEEEDVSVRSRESVHVDWKHHPSRIFQKKPEAKLEIDVRGFTK